MAKAKSVSPSKVARLGKRKPVSPSKVTRVAKKKPVSPSKATRSPARSSKTSSPFKAGRKVAQKRTAAAPAAAVISGDDDNENNDEKRHGVEEIGPKRRKRKGVVECVPEEGLDLQTVDVEDEAVEGDSPAATVTKKRRKLTIKKSKPTKIPSVSSSTAPPPAAPPPETPPTPAVAAAAAKLLELMRRHDGFYGALDGKAIYDRVLDEIQRTKSGKPVAAFWYNRERTEERKLMCEIMEIIMSPGNAVGGNWKAGLVKTEGVIYEDTHLAWAFALRTYFRTSTLQVLATPEITKNGCAAIASAIKQLDNSGATIMTAAYMCSVSVKASLESIHKGFNLLTEKSKEWRLAGITPSVQLIFDVVRKIPRVGPLIGLLITGDSYYYGLTSREEPLVEVGARQKSILLGGGGDLGLNKLGLSINDVFPLMAAIKTGLRNQGSDTLYPTITAENFNYFIMEHVLCKFHRYVEAGGTFT